MMFLNRMFAKPFSIWGEDFAEDLRSQLPKPVSHDVLVAEIRHQLTVVTAVSQNASCDMNRKLFKKLEQCGRDLWNQCIRQGRDSNESIEQKRLLVRVRVFAFLILELGRTATRRHKNLESEVRYLMDLLITLGKFSLDAEDWESARIILQKGAEYVEKLDGLPERDMIGNVQVTRISVKSEYFSLRIALVSGVLFDYTSMKRLLRSSRLGKRDVWMLPSTYLVRWT